MAVAAQAHARLPAEMDALVLRGPGDFSVERVPVPQPGPKEVLCRVRAVAICGTDPHIIEGHTRGRWPKAYPFIPGHEWAGEVVALGEGAEGFGWRLGDRVAGTSHAGCGYCRMCVTGRYNLCENYGREELGHRQYGHYTNGAYAEYAVHSIKSVFKIPENMSFEEAALMDPASIALHAVNRAGVRPGDAVAIIGAGPLGILAYQFAVAVGAGRCFLVGHGERLSRAAELGAEVVDFDRVDPVAYIQQQTGGGVEASVDCAGTSQAIRWAVEVLRKGGRAALTGVPFEATELPMQKVVLEEVEVVGVRANRSTMEAAIALVASGRVQVRPLITHTFPLREFRKAYETFTTRADAALKVVVQP